MMTRSFFLMRWQACRSSGSTDVPVRDSAWHTDCFRTSSAISDGTELVLRVSLLVYWALFKLLHSNWVMRSSRTSLQRLVIDRLELTISYFASKLLRRSFSSENFTLTLFLKFSRPRTSSISSSFGKLSNWILVRTILKINKLEDKGYIRKKCQWLYNDAYTSAVIRKKEWSCSKGNISCEKHKIRNTLYSKTEIYFHQFLCFKTMHLDGKVSVEWQHTKLFLLCQICFSFVFTGY